LCFCINRSPFPKPIAFSRRSGPPVSRKENASKQNYKASLPDHGKELQCSHRSRDGRAVLLCKRRDATRVYVMFTSAVVARQRVPGRRLEAAAGICCQSHCAVISYTRKTWSTSAFPAGGRARGFVPTVFANRSPNLQRPVPAPARWARPGVFPGVTVIAEPTGSAPNARPMTGSATQSIAPRRKYGLLPFAATLSQNERLVDMTGKLEPSVNAQ